MFRNNLAVLSLVVLLGCVLTQNQAQGQEDGNDVITNDIKLAGKRKASERVNETKMRNRQALRVRVETLIDQAASLRNEMLFDDAERVEVEIVKLCFELDSRLVRVNALKQKMAESLLDGKFDDAQMYNREANELLAQLKKDYELIINKEKEKHSESAVSGVKVTADKK
jgi:hypothetical protein